MREEKYGAWLVGLSGASLLLILLANGLDQATGTDAQSGVFLGLVIIVSLGFAISSIIALACLLLLPGWLKSNLRNAGLSLVLSTLTLLFLLYLYLTS